MRGYGWELFCTGWGSVVVTYECDNEFWDSIKMQGMF